MNSLKNKILECEKYLLHTDFTDNLAQLNALLAEDFEEFSPQGCVLNRSSVMDWLLTKDQQARWNFFNFKITKFSERVVMAKYHALKIIPDTTFSTSKGSLCSSIWRKENKAWQLSFHQATKIQ